MTCRGLVVGDDGTGLHPDLPVLARPYRKFFSVDQHAQLAAAGVLTPLPAGEPFEVTAKEDGSLGVCFRGPDGRPTISTRGSFTSDQARWANDYLRSHPELAEALDSALDLGTPCLEIISAASRIVITYATDGLILHGLIDRATGADLPLPPNWPGPVARSYGQADYLALQALDVANEEGYVVRFASGIRVKVKFAGYVRLHGLVTGCTTTMIWEHLAIAALRDAGRDEAATVSRLGIDHRLVAALYRETGDPLAGLLERVPDEFDQWVRAVVADLHTNYAALDAEYRALYASLGPAASRRERSEQIRKLPDKSAQSALFLLDSGQGIEHLIWRAIAPSRQAFTVDRDS
jgi:RNA ligase